MSRICLDTSAYSNYQRGDAKAAQAIDTARHIFVPTIVLGELRSGFRLGRHEERNEADLRRFLAHPIVRILDVDDEAASHYADVVVDLRRQGKPVPTNDMWIAALAMREGAIVVTYDNHFEEIRGLACRVLVH